MNPTFLRPIPDDVTLIKCATLLHDGQSQRTTHADMGQRIVSGIPRTTLLCCKQSLRYKATLNRGTFFVHKGVYHPTCRPLASQPSQDLLPSQARTETRIHAFRSRRPEGNLHTRNNSHPPPWSKPATATTPAILLPAPRRAKRRPSNPLPKSARRSPKHLPKHPRPKIPVSRNQKTRNPRAAKRRLKVSPRATEGGDGGPRG